MIKKNQNLIIFSNEKGLTKNKALDKKIKD